MMVSLEGRSRDDLMKLNEIGFMCRWHIEWICYYYYKMCSIYSSTLLHNLLILRDNSTVVNYIAKQEIIHFLTMCFGKCWLGVLTKTFCHQRLIMEKQNNQIANTLFKIMVRLRVATCSAKFEAPFYDIRDVNNIQWRTKVRNLIVSI